MSNYYNDSTNTNIIPIIRIGEVKNINDITKSGRIKVKIVGVDDNETDDSLIECVPLLPKYLITLPKIGECVFLFQYENQTGTPGTSFKTKRFWIGPLITQPTKLSEESYNSAQSILPDGYTKLKDPNIEEGAYGENEDIVLQGRYNTDVLQKDRQIWLRVGKFVDGDPTKFNSKDVGYIQLKYGGEKLKRKLVDREITTFIQQVPEIEIVVTINTFLNNGTLLSGDLPQSSYVDSDVESTSLSIKVVDIKNNTTKTELETITFNGITSRELAINSAKQFIDLNKGDKWVIKSKANDLIDIYNGSNNIAIFPNKPIEVKKTIKELKLTNNNDVTTSVINVVANKINLISHDGEHTFDITNPKSMITDEEQEKINNKAHPLVYGDILVEFLNLVKKYINLHTHPYHGLPADPNQVKLDVLSFDLNTILNKNINSN